MPISAEERNELIKIEKLELKYLNKYYHFLKFAEDEMFYGFRTKEEIKDDWYGLYGKEKGEKNNRKKISDFAVGAERIVYALLNGKGIGQPNSSPVGSDLFFEVEDAYIHIDLKTVQIKNIGDFSESVVVGKNQNSYKGNMKVETESKLRYYEPALPTFYNKGKNNEKICLSYFITILYNRDTLDILVVTINCMPNGELEKYYKERVLKAGKQKNETRFNFRQVNKFELLESEPSRIKVVFFDENLESKLKKKLKLLEEIYIKQND